MHGRARRFAEGAVLRETPPLVGRPRSSNPLALPCISQVSRRAVELATMSLLLLSALRLSTAPLAGMVAILLNVRTAPSPPKGALPSSCAFWTEILC